MKSNTIVLTHPSGKTVHVTLGFCWPAFLLGPLWAFFKRLWFYFAALMAVMLLLGILDGYAEHTKSLPLMFLNLFLTIASMVVCGKYGNFWLHSSLLKRGYLPAGTANENA